MQFKVILDSSPIVDKREDKTIVDISRLGFSIAKDRVYTAQPRMSTGGTAATAVTLPLPLTSQAPPKARNKSKKSARRRRKDSDDKGEEHKDSQ